MITTVDVGCFPLDRFEDVLDEERMERVREGAERARELLGGRKIWHVNSTARGGGVAEMLIALLPYANGAGVETRWAVIEGNAPFFAVTKRIHNLLHGAEGDGGPLGDDEREAYEGALEPNAEELAPQIGEDDIVVLHDPQTAGLIPRAEGDRRGDRLALPRRARRAERLRARARGSSCAATSSRRTPTCSRATRSCGRTWTATAAASSPRRSTRSRPRTRSSSDDQATAILAHASVIDAPAKGDPPEFTRMDGSKAAIEHQAELLEEAPLAPDDRYVLQVSRWDRLKDPLGVIRGFARARRAARRRAPDLRRPRGRRRRRRPGGRRGARGGARALWRELPDEARAKIHLATLPMDDLDENAAIVNALQRQATIVVQKSIAEGFGLTVAEAMWKGRPVVASRIGGIQDQIEDGRTGVLLGDPEDLEAYGRALVELLADPDRAARIGEAAREAVKDNFLGTESLLHYLALIEPLTQRS